MSTDAAIFKKNSKWFFWDETWTQYVGPFDNEEQATQGCQEYGKYLQSGLYPIILQNKEWKDVERWRRLRFRLLAERGQ